MTKYFIKKETLEEIADIVKNKVGITDALTASEMSEVIENYEVSDKCEQILNRTIKSFENNNSIKVRNNIFNYCSSLTHVNLPACTDIGVYSFNSCITLSSVNFPSCKTIGMFAFCRCSSLTSVNFPSCTNIAASAFNNCLKLSNLTLPGSSVCTLANSNALSYTSIYNGNGYIYVPSSLVASYKAATNWTYFSNQISAI